MRVISLLAKNTKEDDFGKKDDDWEVYKQISKVRTTTQSCLNDAELILFLYRILDITAKEEELALAGVRIYKEEILAPRRG